MPDLRIVFMGTAELACASLEALARGDGFAVVGVVTQPDRPKGRDLKLAPSPVKRAALNLSLPVLQPARARAPEFLDELRALAPDLIVVAAYGQILPPVILKLPPFGCLNVHTSLLPKYRGAAPIQWAILEGEPETGVTIMQMDEGLDTGPILTQAATPITPSDNAQTLHDRLARMGAELLVKTIPAYVAGELLPRPQPDGVTHARKITREDGHLDWNLPAAVLWNRLRAFTPWPGAFTHLTVKGQSRLLKLLHAEVVAAQGAPGQVLKAAEGEILVACGTDALRILLLQLEGGRPLSAQAFLAGHPLKEGQILRSRS